MKYKDILRKRKVNITAVRLLTLKEMSYFTSAFSLLDLENKLQTIDKSTLSRTIHVFLKKNIIHRIDDGSGSVKYFLCKETCNCELEDLHVHFNCSVCKKTICLDNISIPIINLPEGFILEDESFLLKGVCDKCSKHCN